MYRHRPTWTLLELGPADSSSAGESKVRCACRWLVGLGDADQRAVAHTKTVDVSMLSSSARAQPDRAPAFVQTSRRARALPKRSRRLFASAESISRLIHRLLSQVERILCVNCLSAVTPAVVDAACESPGDRGRIAVPRRCLRRLLLKFLRQIILKMTGPLTGMLVDD